MGSNPFYDLTERDLHDTDKLVQLWQFLAKNEASDVTESSLDRIDVVACAERAIEHGNPPLRLFRWLLSNFRRAKEMVTAGQENRALCRIREWESNR